MGARMGKIIVAILTYIINAYVMYGVSKLLEKRKKTANFMEKVPGLIAVIITGVAVVAIFLSIVYIFRSGFYLYDDVVRGNYTSVIVTICTTLVADFILVWLTSYMSTKK